MADLISSATNDLDKAAGGTAGDITHLWEVDHAYYCNLGNYYASESVGDHHARWQDFYAEYKDADFDLNLVFRWDWIEGGKDDESTFDGDIYYRNGTLRIFWMGQRKGLYRYSTVNVCRADESAVRAFLQPRLDYLMNLWAPLLPCHPTLPQPPLYNRG